MRPLQSRREARSGPGEDGPDRDHHRSVRFDDGGRSNLRGKREAGSLFQAVMPMTKAEKDEMLEAVRTLIAPPAS